MAFMSSVTAKVLGIVGDENLRLSELLCISTVLNIPASTLLTLTECNEISQ